MTSFSIQFIKVSLVLIIVALLNACATTPEFDTSGVNLSLVPNEDSAKDESMIGTHVIWGGVIINTENLEQVTRLEVLAYPLDSDQRPNLDKAPMGRFLAERDGYLETEDYAQGSMITLTGTLLQPSPGRIGESKYVYPVMHVDQLFLWPKRSRGSETQFHFGVGVIFSN